MINTLNQVTGICARKTSQLCLILFVDQNFMDINSPGYLKSYEYLLETFKNDPITFTFVLANEEVDMKN